MNCRIITTVLATWMTFTGIITATPLPAKETLETGKFEELLNELISNANEESVKAVMESRNDPGPVANAQSCSWTEWAQCGSVVVSCASDCYNLQASSCISCAGNSYDTCIGCFSRLEQIKKERAVMESRHIPVANAQSCSWSEWAQCGSVVAYCAASCYSLQALSCINCAGGSYDTCKGCFSRLEQVKEQRAVMESILMESRNNHVANAQSCSWSEWAQCGSVVAYCASDCYNLQASSCISCAGDSYNTCKGCFSQLEQVAK